MAMLPEIDIELVETDAEEEQLKESVGRAMLYDYENEQYVVKDGKVVEATQDEAIKQWLYFLIKTKKDKFSVYKGNDFGTNIANYIGYSQVDRGFVEAEVKRELSEEAIKHKNIEGLDNFAFDWNGALLTVSFDVNTVDGKIMEVVANV